MRSIQKIAFVGSGNVAGHLASALHTSGRNIVAVASRSIEGAERMAKTVDAAATTDTAGLKDQDPDLIVIAVPDSAIAGVALQLGDTNAVVVHTSGAVSSDQLAFAGRKTGVFYPLQTFTRGSDVDMKKVPICVHSSDIDLVPVLRELASSISGLVYDVSDQQRQWLHLAAVLINNNINHLLAKVEDLITARSLDRNILMPLLSETVRKAGEAHAGQHQTGPAVRGDESTRKLHLELLRDYGDDRLIELYTYFWRSIQQYHKDDISG